MATYPMNPRISVITLGVNDLEQALVFYRDGLGLQPRGLSRQNSKGMKHTRRSNRTIQSSKWRHAGPLSSNRISQRCQRAAWRSQFHRVQSWIFRAKQRRGRYPIGTGRSGRSYDYGSPHKRAWGIYSGYFKDRDGHLWEIIWAPELLPEEK